MSRAEQIAANLNIVRARLARALQASQRAANSVTLLAVSKTTPPADVTAALAAGQQDFGESYGQELRTKHAAVDEILRANGASARPRWHFIGPLQNNKVKYVVGQVALVHSVASLDLARTIDSKAAAQGSLQECLVQVNVTGEAQKSGVAPADLPALLDGMASLVHLRCRGLMLIPPYQEDAEASRPAFAALRRLQERERAKVRPNVDLIELSMGMSHDLEVAVSEGATIVRVGTAIFGERT
ncbi:MAG: YggS family pyridoxal phosphate-dependent enzyme [Polyangia bacterium]|jgi:pyridoxal phosphate enzyme (YggS family)